MAVIQYVGARYVPKFFDNPSGGSEWLSGVIYEPLTIVTYLNASYTSKKEVPATVGNPASNPEYWIATGNYNAQVESYRQEVVELSGTVNGFADDIENIGNTVERFGETLEGFEGNITDIEGDISALDDRVTNLENDPVAGDFFKSKLTGKKLVLVGDSIVAADNVNGLDYYLRTKYGMTVTKYGFNGAPISGTGANSLYNRIDAIITENSAANVDYFLFLGGANDRNNSLPIGFYEDNATGSGTFVAGLANLIRKLTAAYPKKFIAGITTPHRYNTVNSLELGEQDYAAAMIATCGYMGIPCFDAYNNAGFNLIEGDNYDWADRGLSLNQARDHHPSSAAFEIWADKLAAFLVCSDSNYLESSLVHKFTDANGFSGQMVKLAGGLKMMFIRYTPENKFVCTNQLTDGRYATDDISFAFAKDYFTFVSGAVAMPHGTAGTNLGVIANGYTGANNAGVYRVTSDHSGTFNGHLSVIVFGY